jgi:ammonium transporter, Amt family
MPASSPVAAPSSCSYQIIGVVAVAAFVGVASFILFTLVKMTVGLRVTPEEELEGLDMAEHGSLGYGQDVYLSDSYKGSPRKEAAAAR